MKLSAYVIYTNEDDYLKLQRSYVFSNAFIARSEKQFRISLIIRKDSVLLKRQNN